MSQTAFRFQGPAPRNLLMGLAFAMSTGSNISLAESDRLSSTRLVDMHAVTARFFPTTETGNVEEFVRLTLERTLPSDYKSRASEMAHALVANSTQERLDPLLVLAVIATESQFRPTARGLHGEKGLMQLLPGTAKSFASSNSHEEVAEQLLDPAANIKMGIAYLAALKRQFDGDMRLALSAYNMGPANVRRNLKSGRRPKVYFHRVMANYNLWMEQMDGKSALALHPLQGLPSAQSPRSPQRWLAGDTGTSVVQ